MFITDKHQLTDQPVCGKDNLLTCRLMIKTDKTLTI
jgi:hypothetical protein